jgi:hypothetical protein
VHEIELDEVEELVFDIAQSWGLNPKPRKRKPKPFTPPPTVSWAPCRHWGGTHECPRCKRETEVSAKMARAQQLYEEHSRYVTGRLLRELKVGHVDQRADFRDVEQRVWMAVAARIGMSFPFSAWLHDTKVMGQSRRNGARSERED